MFLRTERLFLRPAWAEDAPELAGAIGQESVVRMLARAPWPYGEAQARQFVEMPSVPLFPNLLVTLPGEGGRIIGGCGLHEGESGGAEIGYWITPDRWGRGYATEAVINFLALARVAGHRRILARHAADNPASARVLCKAGFRPSSHGCVFRSPGRARVEGREYAIDLSAAGGPCDAPLSKAA